MSIESTQHVPDTHVHKTLLRWAISLSPTHLLYVCFIYPIVKFLSLKSCIGTDIYQPSAGNYFKSQQSVFCFLECRFVAINV